MLKVRNWFTIVELLWAVIVISIALLSILWLLRIAIPYTNKTVQETIAINLAREGMEWVYARRNTNRLKRSSEKDKNRLCAKENTTLNECDYRFLWWNTLHRLSYLTGDYGEIPYYIKNGILSTEWSILWDTGFLLSTGDFIWWISPDAAGSFYRAIIGIGLYQKDTNVTGGNLINCIYGTDTYNWIDINWGAFTDQGYCKDSHAKEFRFCSRVEYQKWFQGKVEFCWGITNYEE
jgi:type II secretory pathway pseudopilin PulG